MDELDVEVRFDSAESISLASGEDAFIFYLNIKNNLPKEICVKVPLATYLTAQGEEIEQDFWLTGLINGSSGATIRSKAFKKMGVIISLKKLKEISSGDRLYVILDLDNPSMRFSFGFVCGDESKAEFLLCESNQDTVDQVSKERESSKRDITKCIERLELLEEQFGIAISGLYATCIYQPHGTPPYYEVKINFDVTSLTGSALERNFMLSASAYNPAGQLLDTSSSYIDKEDFLGFGPRSITAHLDQQPARIRLFPVYA